VIVHDYVLPTPILAQLHNIAPILVDFARLEQALNAFRVFGQTSQAAQKVRVAETTLLDVTRRYLRRE
jgi:hypothetical protein